MINLILLVVLVILLLFNSLFMFYLLQRLMLLKGVKSEPKEVNNQPEQSNGQEPKKRPGRKLGSKNKPKENQNKEEVQ